jgi:site-specific DNA-methyltransferase (adenine-specific)
VGKVEGDEGKMSIINIHLGDCMAAMAEMKDNEYDLCVVDPQYGIGESSKNYASRAVSTAKWKRAIPKIYTLKKWDDSKPEKIYFDELMRVSENQIIWGANYFSNFLPPSMGWIYWNKNTSGDYSDGELAFTSFDRALRCFNFTWSGFRKGEPCDRIHPTQKPVKLYEWILKNYAKPGDHILDTHHGSGSLAIACYNLDFDLEAYEIDEEYHAASIARLEQHKAQQRLFA